MRYWDNFSLLTVPTQTEAAQNLSQYRCIYFIVDRLYELNDEKPILLPTDESNGLALALSSYHSHGMD